jgi:hypothetical protein
MEALKAGVFPTSMKTEATHATGKKAPAKNAPRAPQMLHETVHSCRPMMVAASIRVHHMEAIPVQRDSTPIRLDLMLHLCMLRACPTNAYSR